MFLHLPYRILDDIDLLDERTLADFAPGGSFRRRERASQPEAEQHEKTSKPDAGSDTRNHPGCKIHGERFITAPRNLQNEVFNTGGRPPFRISSRHIKTDLPGIRDEVIDSAAHRPMYFVLGQTAVNHWRLSLALTPMGAHFSFSIYFAGNGARLKQPSDRLPAASAS